MSLVLQYVSTFINLQDFSTVTDPMVMLGMIKEVMVPILVISVINLLFSVVLQYYIIYNPLDKENTILVSLIKSLRYFIPYLIIMILLVFAGSIAMALGILVLIVGVFFSILYIMTLYLFILPILMMEGPNIGNTITRTISSRSQEFLVKYGLGSCFYYFADSYLTDLFRHNSSPLYR